jgi:hypothetical protein
MSTPGAAWRRAVRPASKPGHYNVRVISRAHDGTLIVIDLSEVPAAQWRENFGASLSRHASVSPVVHHLHGGVTPCRMPGLPNTWPAGHKWSVHWPDVTCVGCIAAESSPDDVATMAEFVRRGRAAQAAVDAIEEIARMRGLAKTRARAALLKPKEDR